MIPIIIATIIKNATMLLVISVMNSELQLIPIQNSTRIAIPIGLVNRNLSNSIKATKPRMFKPLFLKKFNLRLLWLQK